MPDENKVRFRLLSDGDGWVIERGAWSPKKRLYQWRRISLHQTLQTALVYALDLVVREGYSPKGLEALAARVSYAQALIEGWVKDLHVDPRAYLEIP